MRGEKAQKEERHYVHQGIPNRTFERKFNLADHVDVTGADLINSLLTIYLVREIPEEMKPQSIPINGGTSLLDQRGAEDTDTRRNKAA